MKANVPQQHLQRSQEAYVAVSHFTDSKFLKEGVSFSLVSHLLVCYLCDTVRRKREILE